MNDHLLLPQRLQRYLHFPVILFDLAGPENGIACTFVHRLDDCLEAADVRYLDGGITLSELPLLSEARPP